MPRLAFLANKLPAELDFHLFLKLWLYLLFVIHDSTFIFHLHSVKEAHAHRENMHRHRDSLVFLWFSNHLLHVKADKQQKWHKKESGERKKQGSWERTTPPLSVLLLHSCLPLSLCNPPSHPGTTTHPSSFTPPPSPLKNSSLLSRQVSQFRI